MALNPTWRKEWIPLFSQQLRLRSLTQVLAYNVRGNVEVAGGARPLFYFTLHLTSKSAPFYSSEPCTGPNPRWSEIDLPRHGTLLSGTSLVVRIWQSGSPDQLVTVWGLHLSGLVPVPSQTDLSKELGNNALVFFLHGCAFVSPTGTKPASRLVTTQVAPSEARSSYSPSHLLRLHRVQLDTAEQGVISESLKQAIQLLGPFPPVPLGAPGRRYEAQQLKCAREEARHRLCLLRGERARRSAVVAGLRNQAGKLAEEGQQAGSVLSTHCHSLSREVDRLRESRLVASQTREELIHATSQLANRRRQLISQLKLIYPITEDTQGSVKICGVPLVSSESLNSQDESSSAVALGFAAHATSMVATFLDVPLRYPIVAAGSRARVWDLVAPKLPDSEREFPLFSRGRDKIQFNYAVYLLNKDIAQLRWYCGLPTRDLRATLLNLRDLLHMRAAPASHHKRSLSGSSLELAPSRSPVPPPLATQVLRTQAKIEATLSQEEKSRADSPKPNKTSGSLESWDCFLEPPLPKERSLEKEPALSCSLDQGLDTIVKQPRLNHASGLLSASKAVNCSEPSLNVRDFPSSGEVSEPISDSQLCVNGKLVKPEEEEALTELPASKFADSEPVTSEPTFSAPIASKAELRESVNNGAVKSRTFSEPGPSIVTEEFHDCLSVPDPSTFNAEPSFSVSKNLEEGDFNGEKSSENNESVLTKFNSIDSIFAKVASRTEALASKSGSFNLVKSRASTMESS